MYHVSIKFRNTHKSSMGEPKKGVASVPTAFLVLPNFHLCFYSSIETRTTCFLFLLEKTVTKKGKQLVNFIIKM